MVRTCTSQHPCWKQNTDPMNTVKNGMHWRQFEHTTLPHWKGLAQCLDVHSLFRPCGVLQVIRYASVTVKNQKFVPVVQMNTTRRLSTVMGEKFPRNTPVTNFEHWLSRGVTCPAAARRILASAPACKKARRARSRAARVSGKSVSRLKERTCPSAGLLCGPSQALEAPVPGPTEPASNPSLDASGSLLHSTAPARPRAAHSHVPDAPCDEIKPVSQLASADQLSNRILRANLEFLCYFLTRHDPRSLPASVQPRPTAMPRRFRVSSLSVHPHELQAFAPVGAALLRTYRTYIALVIGCRLESLGLRIVLSYKLQQSIRGRMSQIVMHLASCPQFSRRVHLIPP